MGIEEAKTKALAQIVKEQEVTKFVEQDFDRFDKNYVDHYKGMLGKSLNANTNNLFQNQL